MVRPKIGDKIFLYGQFIANAGEFTEYDYNSVMGYMTTGGYLVTPIETDIFSAAVPGFISEMPLDDEFTTATPFSNMKLVDITDKLSRGVPLPAGTTIWMPLCDVRLLPSSN